MKNLFIFLLVALVGILPLSSQDEIPEVTNKIVVRNAHITVRPGTTIDKGSIFIEDGLIKEVGSAVAIPADAKVVDGDSLFVYAGFIAPLSHVGIPRPKENNERPRVKRPGYPPNDVAGITPERNTEAVYSASEGNIDAMRKEGFGIAHSVPYGRMMPGKGAVISLNGKSFNESVLRKEASLMGSLTGTRGVFPATTIGVMSKWREMFENARLAMAHMKAYQANPRNKKRPSHDAAVSALFPVIEGDMPVFFLANTHVDIHRVIQLQKDLGFDLVLGEIEQGYMALDAIGSHAKMSLISLELPEAIKEEEDKTKDEKDNKETKEVSKEAEHLKKRKKETVERYEKQAGDFAAGNIPFSFSYLEVKPKDIMTNVKRMIKSGLSEDVALAALTTSAAEAIGVDNVAGTIEKGKIGNLVVSTKPLFSEDAKIKFIFVDGKQYEMDIKEKKKSGGGEVAVDLVGVWDYEIDIPGMLPKGTMTFSKDGDDYAIDLTNDQNPGEVISVKGVSIDGAIMSFEYDVDGGGMSIRVMTDIEFDGTTFEGEVSVAEFGSFPVKGEKQSKPE